MSKEPYLDTVCSVQATKDLYLIFWTHKTTKGKVKKIYKKKTDADTMCGNTLLPVNQKACIPHCQHLPK